MADSVFPHKETWSLVKVALLTETLKQNLYGLMGMFMLHLIRTPFLPQYLGAKITPGIFEETQPYNQMIKYTAVVVII